jgi:hypothetical protein
MAAESAFRAYLSVAVYDLDCLAGGRGRLTPDAHSVRLTSALAGDVVLMGETVWRYWSPDVERLSEIMRNDFTRIEHAVEQRSDLGQAAKFPQSLFGSMWPGRRPAVSPPDLREIDLQDRFEAGALGYLGAGVDAGPTSRRKVRSTVVRIGDSWRAFRRDLLSGKLDHIT